MLCMLSNTIHVTMESHRVSRIVSYGPTLIWCQNVCNNHINYSHLVYTICHDKLFQTLSISKLSYHLFSWIIVFLWYHISSYNLANIGPGNGLLPNGTKPLPELILANNLRSWAIQLMATGNAHDICPYCEFDNCWFKNEAASPGSQWFNSSSASATYMRQWIG